MISHTEIVRPILEEEQLAAIAAEIGELPDIPTLPYVDNAEMPPVEPASSPDNSAWEAELTKAYEEHFGDMFRIALSWTRNAALAEDLVHDMFERAWRYRGGFEDRGNGIVPWLSDILRNVILTHHSRKKNGEVPVEPEVASRAIGDVAINHAPSAESAFIDTSPDGVRRVLAKLPESQRGLFALVVFGGYNSKEAARILGISHGTARKRMHFGRGTLRELVVSGKIQIGDFSPPAQLDEAQLN